MKCLILGASGLLGSGIYQVLNRDPRIDAVPAVRSFEKINKLLDVDNIVSFSDVTATHELEEILCKIKPDIVINCIGIVKSLVNIVPMNELYYINSIFPYILSKITSEKKIDLIHFSTDCVFSGKTGNYKEADFADSQDSYGRSKFYGEVQNENTLVFRISVIGRELMTNRGLIEWFLQQQDVNGFLNAIFSGLPSVSIGNFIIHYLTFCQRKTGLFHLSADPISKYELLNIVNSRLGKEIKINPTESPFINRSLNSNKLREEFGWHPKDWYQLVDEMCELQYD